MPSTYGSIWRQKCTLGKYRDVDVKNQFKKIFRCLILLLVAAALLFTTSCGHDEHLLATLPVFAEGTSCPLGDSSPVVSIQDLKPGDLLIRPNMNWLYGTSGTLEGDFFGHAVIVTEGATDSTVTGVMQKSLVFESVARQLPAEHQVREIPALVENGPYLRQNHAFVETGARYRLRPDLSPDQVSRMIEYVRKQDDATHSWRAIKYLDSDSSRVRSKWYCSLLIWQAFYDLEGLDLDCNGGYVVYPNDLINHPYFDGAVDGVPKRVRF